MNENLLVDEALDEIQALNPFSLFTTPVRYAPTIGDQQAEIARVIQAKNAADHAVLPSVGIRLDQPVDRKLHLVRQEHCPYCNARTYKVDYTALKGVVSIKGACSHCGYRAQSLRGGSVAAN